MHEVALLCVGGGELTDTESMEQLGAVLAENGMKLCEVRWLDAGQFRIDALTGQPRRTVIVRILDDWAARAVRAALGCGGSPGEMNPTLVVDCGADTPDRDHLVRLREALGAQLITAPPSLATQVVTGLVDGRLVLVTAESCTGGMLGAEITAIPGSSAAYWGSFVTYSNEAKRRALGVAATTLERYGAVSEEVVREMARGARQRSGADISVAISGIAGPGGGSPEKPVGTVWLACDAGSNETVTRLLRLSGDRDRIRHEATREGLQLIQARLTRDGRTDPVA